MSISKSISSLVAAAIAFTIVMYARAARAQPPQAASAATPRPPIGPPAFMPDAAASKIVSVARSGKAQVRLVIITEAVAVNETGPKATLKRFGEVYAFSPASIFVRQNQPTRITFWNLQPDDEHDFSIVDPAGKPMMDLPLAPLSQSSFIFTFYRPGILQFRCLVHQPGMSGQILVLPER
jgi:plastocyanin